MLPALPAGVTDTGAWTLLQVVAKATLVLALAALAARPLRRAAARHLVWSLALGALLILPPLSLALPAWRLPWLRVQTRADLLPAALPVTPELAAATGPAAGRLLLALWAAGALLVVGRMLTGWYGVRRLGRAAREVADPQALAEVNLLAIAAGVDAPIRLLSSETVAMPATWGVVRPTVLLPAEAAGWSVERRRVVLLHELAHVARRDWLTQTLASICCAAYWFHPGAWWAARRMRIEREEACDDRVVAAGARPSDYAGHLLEVARTFRRASSLSSAALAMARPSQLESRVRAVLDARRDRRGVAYGGGALLAAGVALALLPLATATPTERVVLPATPSARIPLRVARASTPGGNRAAPVAARSPVRAPAPRVSEAISPVAAAAPAEPIAPPAPLPLAARDEEEMIVDAAVLRSRSLAELIRATASPQATVRRDAVRALAQIRDEAVVSPLARSLRDQDPGVRTMAARALGEMAVARPRTQEAVAAPAEDAPAEAVAYALANRAAEALRVSLSDQDPGVRDTALRALEEVGGALEGGGGGGGGSPAVLQTGISTIVAPGS